MDDHHFGYITKLIEKPLVVIQKVTNMTFITITMHSMPSSTTYVKYFCMSIQHKTNFKKISKFV